MKDDVSPLVVELFAECTLQEIRIQIGTHYFAHSWSMTSMNIQFFQHHAVYQLKSLLRCQRVKIACRQRCAGTSLAEQIKLPPSVCGLYDPINECHCVSVYLQCLIQGSQIFQKSRKHLKVLGARMVS